MQIRQVIPDGSILSGAEATTIYQDFFAMRFSVRESAFFDAVSGKIRGVSLFVPLGVHCQATECNAIAVVLVTICQTLLYGRQANRSVEAAADVLARM